MLRHIPRTTALLLATAGCVASPVAAPRGMQRTAPDAVTTRDVAPSPQAEEPRREKGHATIVTDALEAPSPSGPTTPAGHAPAAASAMAMKAEMSAGQSRARHPRDVLHGAPPANPQALRSKLARGAAQVDANEAWTPFVPERPVADEEQQVNGLVATRDDALSTFAIDVDTGSYTLARRALEHGALPTAGLVRVEEWVNAFSYGYADEAGEHPFSIHLEGAPLTKNSHVLRVGIQGKRIPKAERAPVHLTFLVDVSGSMQGEDRLPLAQRSLELLVDELGPKDSVSLVTYAGSTGVVLPSTSVKPGHVGTIKQAIRSLTSGGGTNMGSGMELAYREAGKALEHKGVSRVIVLSDGDANIGRTSFEDILASIRGYVSEGVTLSTVGFGTGNYRDDLMERLADAGNGNYSYVGSEKDARRIFVDNLTGTLQVIALDTKIQVEMNPDVVEQYRLIGYENRAVADRDFRNDKVDAGEIGAGHTVTALYEVQLKNDAPTGDIATVRVRYKEPRGTRATEVTQAFARTRMATGLHALSSDGRFAAGVALAAESFRHSPHMERLGLTLADAVDLMRGAARGPHAAEREELVGLLTPFAAGGSVAVRQR